MRKGKKDFGALMTATRNWREEILAYFDHPISNGYTEALNGVAKVINRAGRGYSFPVLRARILFKNKQPTLPTPGEVTSRSAEWQAGHDDLMEALGNRCKSCGGIFEGRLLTAQDVPPLLPGEHPSRIYVCPTCVERFHTIRGFNQHTDSTQ